MYFSGVMMAARSLIQLFRSVNPALLHKKDRVSKEFVCVWVLGSAEGRTVRRVVSVRGGENSQVAIDFFFFFLFKFSVQDFFSENSLARYFSCREKVWKVNA